MRVIEPINVIPSMVTATNVAAESLPAWNVGTTYANGARIIFENGIWESVQANNLGKNPGTDTLSEWWVRRGATNTYRPFDQRLGEGATGGATIMYSITLPRTLNALCFFGMNGTSVQVRVITPGPTVIYDQTIQLASRDAVGNAWEYVNNPFAFKPDLVLTGIRLPSGSTVEITISAGSAAQVGEIFLGNDIAIGVTLEGSRLGIVDYSKKDRDEWGGVFLVPRPVTKTVNFQFSIPTEGAARVQEIIERITSKACVFYAVNGEDAFGTTVAGIMRDYDLTLSAGRSFGTIQAESLT